ncbi:ADP-heptose:LPS heptosyltransferase II [Serratia symbiotica str. 'Cinara cedri']|nr:ADP-heptose:LPS heptosyltransferase II [Serratia symbiotica str. 'Cinara cedri']
MKILVIGPSWVGDMMMSQSLYRTLKVEYSSSVEIDVIAPAWCYSLLKCMPEVHQALLMPLSHGALDLRERLRIGYALRANQYDYAYVLPNSFKSALVPFFANIPKRIGWCGEIRYGLINDLRLLNKAAFPLMIQRYIALAYDKGRIQCADDLPQPLLWPYLQVSKEDMTMTAIMFHLDNYKSMIGFCPGAEFGHAKRWPHYHYITLAQALISQGYQILLLGSVKDYALSEQIRTGLPEGIRDDCINLAGRTQINQIVILISLCQAIVSNDSGLMHIAAALSTPLIALYGPSSPNFTPPLSYNATVIRLISGYYKMRKGRSAEGYHQSLIDIHPRQVLKALRSLLIVNEK